MFQITVALSDADWHSRLSLLTHRYQREDTFLSDPDIVEKSFRTLELFCVGSEAKESLLVSHEPYLDLQGDSIAGVHFINRSIS